MADPQAPPIGLPAPPAGLLKSITSHHSRVKRPCQVCGLESVAWLKGAWQCCDAHYDYASGKPKTEG